MCLSELRNTSLIAHLLIVEFVSLLLKELKEDLHQVEVRRWSDVDVSFHEFKEVLAHLLAVCVELETHMPNLVL